MPYWPLVERWWFAHARRESVFVNTQDKKGVANTHMERFFDEDRFEIYATRKCLVLFAFFAVVGMD